MIITQMMPMAITAITVINITITGNVTDFNPYTYRNTGGTNITTSPTSAYVAGTSKIIITINSGVYLGSSTIAGYGLNIDNSWNTTDTVSVINNGFIIGTGGYGGTGSSNYGPYGGTAGATGGSALRAQIPISVNNIGTIAGGGGGGGGGGQGVNNPYAAAGGSGGGGAGLVAGAAGGQPGAGGSTTAPAVASAGTLTTGGAGGVAYAPYYGGNGGAGGTQGSAGAGGATGGGSSLPPYNSPGGGGAGGNCTSTGSNANITWIATGTRYGTLA